MPVLAPVITATFPSNRTTLVQRGPWNHRGITTNEQERLKPLWPQERLLIRWPNTTASTSHSIRSVKASPIINCSILVETSLPSLTISCFELSEKSFCTNGFRWRRAVSNKHIRLMQDVRYSGIGLSLNLLKILALLENVLNCKLRSLLELFFFKVLQQLYWKTFYLIWCVLTRRYSGSVHPKTSQLRAI